MKKYDNNIHIHEIGINLLSVREATQGGGHTYLSNIIREMSLLENINITIYGREDLKSVMDIPVSIKRRVITSRAYNHLLRVIQENYTLPNQLRSSPPSVLFSPLNIGVCRRLPNIPQVITICDLQHLDIPQNFSLAQRIFRSSLISESLKVADAVIAISEFTKKQIIKHYGIKSEKIHVIYLGINSIPNFSVNDRRSVLDKYSLPNLYFYYPASLYPHKNHRVLLEAWASSTALKNSGAKLIFSGGFSKFHSELKDLIDKLNIEPYVQFLGYIKSDEVLSLMSSATAIVFPSFYEGFGLPLIESMQVGTPVIASDIEVVREITAGCAILTCPNNYIAWAENMEKILDNSALKNTIITSGKAVAKKFDWQQCAEKTVNVLLSVAQ